MDFMEFLATINQNDKGLKVKALLTSDTQVPEYYVIQKEHSKLAELNTQDEVTSFVNEYTEEE